jgi:hypothetical protein
LFGVACEMSVKAPREAVEFCHRFPPVCAEPSVRVGIRNSRQTGVLRRTVTGAGLGPGAVATGSAELPNREQYP